MILYKYLPPVRTDVIRDGRIRYTQPLVFNDPFESKPHIAGMLPLKLMEEVSRVESKEMGLTEEQRQAILKLSQDPERHQQVEMMMMALIAITVGVLSLAEKCSNLLMWAHYASEHSGCVIGFDTNHEYWNNFGDEKGNDHAGVLRKVDYSERRPSAAHLASMKLREMYFAKSLEWEYEQEWRVFRSLDKVDHFIEADGRAPICLFDFPKESVAEIVLGCRSTEALQTSILEILGGSPGYAKTKVLRATIDSAEFRLNFHPIPRPGQASESVALTSLETRQ